MKVGVIMTALALVLVIATAVVSATLRSEPERVVPAEVARRSPSEAPPNSSDEEGIATKKYSSEKDSPLYPSGKQDKGSLGYGPTSSSSNEVSVEQRKEEAKEPQTVPQQEEAEPLNSESSIPQPGSQQTSPEAPSGPQPQPYKYQPSH